MPGLHLPRFTLEQYKSAYCNVITNTGKKNEILENTILLTFSPRRVQLPKSRVDIQARVLLLLDNHLRAVLHAGYRQLGFLLA